MNTKSIINSWLYLFTDIAAEKLLSKDDIEWISSFLTHKHEANGLKDQWGNFDIQYTLEDHRKPFLDNFVIEKLQGSGIKLKSIWPDNADMAVILSHDMDAVSSSDPVHMFRKFKKSRGSGNIGKLVNTAYMAKSALRRLFPYLKDDLWAYEKWFLNAGKNGFRQTVFVYVMPDKKFLHEYDCDYDLNDRIIAWGKVMKVRDFIKKLSESETEIGIHGSYLTAGNPELFAGQVKKLEEVINKPVTSVRQHYLRFDWNSTPEIHLKAGILNDSTLGFNRGCGYRAGTGMPYFLSTGILEIPMNIMDGSLFRNNSMELTFEHACSYIDGMLDSTERNHSCITLNFHPNYLNNPLYFNTWEYLLDSLSRRKVWAPTITEMGTYIRNYTSNVRNSGHY